MPALKTYDLFISHAWKYGDEYDRLVNLLSNASNFLFRNYSAPEDKPLVPAGTTISDAQLRKHIDNKIKPVNVVLVLSGMYYNYHDWMQQELSIAQSYSKPIIAIKPWGNKVVPTEIQNLAWETVGWNTNSIVAAVRKYAI